VSCAPHNDPAFGAAQAAIESGYIAETRQCVVGQLSDESGKLDAAVAEFRRNMRAS